MTEAKQSLSRKAIEDRIARRRRVRKQFVYYEAVPVLVALLVRGRFWAARRLNAAAFLIAA